MDDTRLGALLLEGNLVREEDLERCLEIQALTGGGRPLGQVLVEQDVITEHDLDQILRLQHQRRLATLSVPESTSGGVERFLNTAFAAGATELILSEGKPAMIRLAGELRAVDEEPLQPPEMWQFLLDYMGADVLDRLADQQYITREFVEEGAGRGRITAFRHFDGACCVACLQPFEVRTPGEAGLTPEILDCVHNKKGLILLTGERRSGMTSTMATLLSEVVHDAPQLVVVLDENKEYDLVQGTSQLLFRRVGRDTKSYESGLEAAIREDPDVIVVADVGTPRTFDLALRAAEGGRLVIAALNARNVHAAIVRALNFYPDYDVPRIRNSLAAVLNCVIRQQLVPDATATTQKLATELLVMDNSSRAVLRDGLLSRLQLLMNMEDGASGYGMDVCLERMFKNGEIELEEAFRHADDKARFLRRTNAKAVVKQ